MNSDATAQAQQDIRSFAEQQKTLGANQLDGVAMAVHGAARELEEQMPAVARSVHDAATRLEGAAASIKAKTAGELMSTMNDFARQQPAVFFGAAILAGFAASRFLKSSAHAPRGK